jgi:hypothetical protein
MTGIQGQFGSLRPYGYVLSAIANLSFLRCKWRHRLAISIYGMRNISTLCGTTLTEPRTSGQPSFFSPTISPPRTPAIKFSTLILAIPIRVS